MSPCQIEETFDLKQVVQNLRSGTLRVEEIPTPVLRNPGILVRSRASLISAGTERASLKLAQSTLIGKAQQRPDLVQRVLDKLRRDGFVATFRAVRQQLDRETPLGYSLAGDVIAVGDRAREFSVGELVACAGAGYANHAEINYVPRLLAAKVPAGVDAESAAYATVGAIALQGIRNADVRVGETVVVMGLGLLGQLAVQMLSASGCQAIGLDLAPDRVALARQHGAALALAIGSESVEEQVLDFTRGRGADAILITAATTSNEPVESAARLARHRARVVMVGVTGMNIPRNAYYEKELCLIVSRSYGPGRYDPQYEQHGHDYPPSYVRWTEQRNLEAFLDLVASGRVQPKVCTTHRFAIDEAEQAFELIMTNREPYLGVVLTYPQHADAAPSEPARIVLRPTAPRKAVDRVGVSFIGAGGFAQSVLLPALGKLSNVELRGVVTSSGISARSAGKKFGFAYCASSADEVLADQETNVVFVATRHATHADVTCRVLEAGKAVFVEKPLAVTLDDLRRIRDALVAHPQPLMVGFNRRFAPLASELKSHFAGRGPLSVHYRCNAGPLPPDHWLADPSEGGRIIGEACHFIDFFAFLTDSEPVRVYASAPEGASHDDAAITIDYADGSACQLLYTTTGPPSFSKERVEVFGGGRVGVLEDFRVLRLEAIGGKRKTRKLTRGDKGHAEELRSLIQSIRCGASMPIAADSLMSTTLASYAAVRSIARREPVTIAALVAELDDDAPEPDAGIPAD